MKKYLLLFAIGGGSLMFMNSCSKCDSCDGGTEDGEEICSSDDTDRDLFKARCELGGGDVR